MHTTRAKEQKGEQGELSKWEIPNSKLPMNWHYPKTLLEATEH